MNSPICDFVKNYIQSSPARLHMPGHKGADFLGCEAADITEISGADSLYEAVGIIKESEENASTLFGCNTFYSTEGSSHCIRAMLYLALLHAKERNLSPMVFAARNAHKAFLTAGVLLDFQIKWLYGENRGNYLSCNITPDYLDKNLSGCAQKPMAVYITSPDYLGNVADISGLSLVCRKHGVLLLVDNAHGAYLKFLPKSRHPMDLGADICCDSAHKTLPVLTGGAYLHIAKNASERFSALAKDALSLFGSTSPSYLILQSLDLANKYISEKFPEQLRATCDKVQKLKDVLQKSGYTLYGNEELKITVSAKSYGYTGTQLAQMLRESNIICEFADPDFLVLMFTPQCEDETYTLLEKTMTAIPKKTPMDSTIPTLTEAESVMSPKEAMLCNSEVVNAEICSGRILASANISCPPAVPIVVCGEIITKEALKLFEYYGITTCKVIKEN